MLHFERESLDIVGDVDVATLTAMHPAYAFRAESIDVDALYGFFVSPQIPANDRFAGCSGLVSMSGIGGKGE